ncbi:MAG TPA: polyprenol monophosphomannose synthase [Egibacteraceae bacterium]|nr:polyprenol monophosphomannose synthase [Egibacteraceae bacterium]
MRPLVVVPTYNEIATLERVVSGALAADARLHVLVVDDGSPDGTGDLAEKLALAGDGRVAVLHRRAKSGLGSAYKRGFEWGMARGYDVLCEMDADLSHNPADLARLLAALESADLAIGSRYVRGGGVVDWPLHRRLLSRMGNRYVRLITGMPLRDATAGFRAYRVPVVEEVNLDSLRAEGYAFQLEMALRTWRLGFAITEVPITFVERTEGASKISRAIVVEALWRAALWGLRGPRRAAPTHPRSICSQ